MILSPRAPANAPMEKGPEAYRTIREVADSLDLPQHVLRFWETRFPQIRPLKRAGGRRYYRPDDIERLRIIKRLLYDEGYTIKGVQKLFKEQGVQALSAVALSPVEPLEAPASAAEPPAWAPEKPSAPDTRPRIANDELAALREALAEIGEAKRILAHASAPAS
jgi:DNA-binding transcriptional MerR regulator